jgi:hypothetical protein
MSTVDEFQVADIRNGETIFQTAERYRLALVAIAAYSPGDFRPLEDEVKIWNLATDALATNSGGAEHG